MDEDQAFENICPSNNLEFFDALLYGLDVGAELQPALLLELFLCLPQPSPNVLQVRVQLLPLLLVLLCTNLFAEVLSLQELPALDHSWRGKSDEITVKPSACF